MASDIGYQPGEERPGGDATHQKNRNKNAFSHSSANLPFKEEFNFKLGNGIFKKVWVSSPSSTKSSDGLGPLFNAKSCQRCHLKDGRGHPPRGNPPEDTAVSMFLRLSIPPQTDEEAELIRSGKALVIPDPVYGTQLQDFSIQGIPAEGNMIIHYQEKPVMLDDGERVFLRAPSYSIKNLQYGPLHPDIRLSPRVAPQMIGLGLIAAIDEKDILAKEDILDENEDGISGKAQRVYSPQLQKNVIGRFGWKAASATLEDQNQGAFVGDIGLSTPLFPKQHSGDCTKSQRDCKKAPNGAGKAGAGQEPEVPKKLTDLVLFYTENLAPPFRMKAKDPLVLSGKQVFNNLGCVDCHRATYRTKNAAGSPQLSHQKIWPYSDFLLHDMGEGLADNRPAGRANGREWRTAPLWGIGFTETVSGHTNFLHDGRARNLTEAILWHGGEAQAAKKNFMALSKEDRNKLIAFLNSL